MAQGTRFRGLGAVCAVVVGGSAVLGVVTALAQSPSSSTGAQAAAEQWVKNNPSGRSVAAEHPVPKDNAHPKITAAQREELGLPAPTWVAVHGKIQPAVRDAMEQQRRRIDAGEPMLHFQGDRPAGFEGMAYVDVYLRHEAKGQFDSAENQAAIKDAQTKILSKLTAAQFSLIGAPKITSGLVGYVDETGLAKLADEPQVVAVGLDDQSRPEDPPRAAHGEPGVAPGPAEKRGKVEVAVYTVLEKTGNGYVFVTVMADRGVSTGASVHEKHLGARKVQDQVLSELLAEELKLRSRSALSASFAGYVNAAGLAKLERHPAVKSVGLNQGMVPLTDKASRRKP